MTRFTTFTDPLNGALAPGGGKPIVLGVNDNGTYYGLIWNDKTLTQSQFLYENGGFTVLNIPFRGSNPANTIYSQIYEVNSSGKAVGNYFESINGVSISHGFIYQNGKYLNLDHPLASTTAVLTVPAKGNFASFSSSGTIITGINDAGHIVGNYIDQNAKGRGYLYADNKFTTIDGPLGSGANISDINDAGQIIGSYQDTSGKNRGFIYSSGKYQTIDAPFADNTDTRLHSINDAGAIVGSYFDANGSVKNFYYDSGTFAPITVPSDTGFYGVRINDKGLIAGTYTTGNPSKGSAEFHSFQTQTYDLSSVTQSAFSDSTYLLYQASFARLPDEDGFKYWAGQAASNKLTFNQLAKAFMASPEFSSVFGVNSSNADYINKLYNNVLGRDPDASGAQFWTNQLDSGVARDTVLVGFALSPENVSGTASHMVGGYWVL